MDLNLDKSSGNQITAYEAGSITINETSYTNSIIVTPEAIISPWELQDIADLSKEKLHQILELEPHVVILGTGEKQQFPKAELLAYFGTRGIGLEVMNNGAACRTYNVLMSEDRKVVLALLIA